LGIGLGDLMVGAVIFIVLAMFGMKLGPSYLEFFAIKKAVNAIAQEKRTASVVDIRKTWDARATTDDINSVTGKDIEITKDGSELVISASYRKEIPLAGNLGVYIDFRANSKE
ncbi:MAG: DUF4845 domain-containing protein, partial [Betaproteobacteria bacterium]|nr:DUF4845 domain-containing protein [Betaproteobacteria bacterium]